jgi:tRNA G18 (ribose-2'-O)-methylase SpoU
MLELKIMAAVFTESLEFASATTDLKRVERRFFVFLLVEICVSIVIFTIIAYNIGMEEDTRNLKDHLKGLENEVVKAELDKNRSKLEVAIENVEHDFNAGTIVRSANNFNVQKLHIIGRKKYNRRGAMCTDKYLHVEYWPDIDSFIKDQKSRNREIVAIENNTKCKPLAEKVFKPETTLVFGSEGSGISEELLSKVDEVREIESTGSTRSINVGVAAGIAMYEWFRQNQISD